MTDGRTRIAFDKGCEHKYKPSSLHKLQLVKPAPTGAEFATSSEAKVIAVLKCLNKRGRMGSARAGYSFDGESDVMTAQLVADQIALLASFGKRELKLLRAVQTRFRSRLARVAKDRAEYRAYLHSLDRHGHHHMHTANFHVAAHGTAAFVEHAAHSAALAIEHSSHAVATRMSRV